jgi:hypothetical protein
MSEANRTSSGNYRQQWDAYNAAQTNEKRQFPQLLYNLCQGVEEPEQVLGRPRMRLRDMIFCAVFRTYQHFPSRRFDTDLQEARDRGWITDVPHFNTVFKYLKEEWLTPYLQELIQESSLPLKEVEKYFAVDSTGLRTSERREYFNRHKNRSERRRVYLKLHAICGVQTNVIASVVVSEGEAADNSFFKHLVREAAKYFNISEVYADAGYVDAGNMLQTLLVGGKPYIAFRSNCTTFGAAKSTLWKRMLTHFRERNVEFMKHYYRRNNVESTFSMMHRKFDKLLRGRNYRSRVNEALCKVLCHNICVLIHAMYELGIDPSFWTEPPPPPEVVERRLNSALNDSEYALVQERLVASRQIASKASPPARKKGEATATVQGELLPLSLFDCLTSGTDEQKGLGARSDSSAETQGGKLYERTGNEGGNTLPLFTATEACQQPSLF